VAEQVILGPNKGVSNLEWSVLVWQLAPPPLLAQAGRTVTIALQRCRGLSEGTLWGMVVVVVAVKGFRDLWARASS